MPRPLYPQGKIPWYPSDNTNRNYRTGTATISNSGKKCCPYIRHNIYNLHNNFTTAIHDTTERERKKKNIQNLASLARN
jgi:hypothetical protein